MGRFINADTLISTGAGLLGYNMFAYCDNNPVIHKDPTGDFWRLIIPLIIPLFLSGCGEDTKKPYSGMANCYAYAMRLENDPRSGKPFSQKPDPGTFSGAPLAQNELTCDPPTFKTLIERKIADDAKALGYSFREIPNIYDSKPAEGNWYIAIAYCPSPATPDYHFWRQDADGAWSHKHGILGIDNLDYSGNKIYDPMSCDRGQYTFFIGYYEVGPNVR